MKHHLSSSFSRLMGCGFLIGFAFFSAALAAQEQWQPWPDDTFASSCPESVLPDGAVARLGTRRFVAPGIVVWMAFSADDRSLLSVDFESGQGEAFFLRAWDASVGSQTGVWTFPRDEDAGEILVAADPASRVLAVRHGKTKVLLWDLVQHKALKVLETTCPPTCLKFSHDGKRLVMGTEEGTAEIWGVEKGERQATLESVKEPVSGIVFSPDDRVLIFDDGGTVATSHRLDNSGWRDALRISVRRGFTELAVSADGAHLGIDYSEEHFQIYELETGKHVKTIPSDADRARAGFVVALRAVPEGFDCVSHDGILGARLLTNHAEGSGTSTSRMSVHRLGTTVPPDWSLGHSDGIWDVQFLTDRNTVVTHPMFFDHYLVWDLANRRVRRVRTDHLMATAASPRVGDFVAAERFDSDPIWPDTLDILDYRSGKTVQVAKDDEFPRRWSTYSANNGMLAYVNPEERAVCCWDVQKHSLVRRIALDAEGCWDIALSWDGRQLAVVGDRGQIRFWDVPSGQLVLNWEGDRKKEPNSLPGFFVDFWPDGRHLALADYHGTWRIRTIPSGRVVARIPGGGGHTAIAPDGRFTAIPDREGNIRLVDVKACKILDCGVRHAGGMDVLVFSPDGKYLASAGWDMTVLLWDVERLKQMAADREKARRPTSKRCLRRSRGVPLAPLGRWPG
ncbi:MAG TPA: hypothetical protein DD670_20450 [Planctomycetaceae bacterium]|nr:hypothetical protein [Planctomycetaceae bacterium]